ncbi:MAG: hypothetical protein AAGF13_03625 [Pseudomonadota bacterium]
MTDVSQEIAEYEARLVEALSRIQNGIDKWPKAPAEDASPTTAEDTPSPSVAPDEVAKLREELEEERTANAQLQQRVRQIRRKQEERVGELEEQLKEVETRNQAFQKEAAKAKRASEGMRQAMQDLQSASEQGAADAHLINRAMMAELEALRAERAADAREIADIVKALEPLVEVEA